MMTASTSLVFKFASEDWELEQIHRLNYRIFVEEIPQHQPSASSRLVDKFHAENTYLICLKNQKLIGMLAVRGKRPFSLDQKLPDLDHYLPPHRTICEVRLLAIEPSFRGMLGGQILQSLLALLWQHCVEKNYGCAIISGTTRQQKLYRHLGFAPFGPLVGSGDARFQPMQIMFETFETNAREFLRSQTKSRLPIEPVNFLPGPVTVRRAVRQAFEQVAVSHRSENFKTQFQTTQKLLCELVRTQKVELFTGSGTLANDVVAGQLSLLGGRGLIVTNGEFGERLLDHGRRFGLQFKALSFAWGEPFDLALVEKELSSGYAWLWCAHCETSTGILADISALKNLSAQTGTKLCLDAISSIGTLPVDLSGVYLASGTSGKGLRAYPGLAMVFHHHAVASSRQLPRCLDLGFYSEQDGIPFTLSSNLLNALQTSLKGADWEKGFVETASLSARLRSDLCGTGFDLIGENQLTSPAVISIALPAAMDSKKIGEQLERAGYWLSYKSDYLCRKNWLQICLMGECTSKKITALVAALNQICFGNKFSATSRRDHSPSHFTLRSSSASSPVSTP